MTAWGIAGGTLSRCVSLVRVTCPAKNGLQAIGECKSKAEEDRIITQELELLKQRLSDPKLDKSRGKEYMIRLIYCEMLGHDASFAYIKALQFASDPNIHTKKVPPPTCAGKPVAQLAGGTSLQGEVWTGHEDRQ